MLGNRFHTAGTPPAFDIPGIGPLGGANTPSVLSVADEQNELDDITDDDERTLTTSIPQLASPAENEDNLPLPAVATSPSRRRPSHTDQAIELVESITGTNKLTSKNNNIDKNKSSQRKTRPSVLASLLKLDGLLSRPRPSPARQQQRRRPPYRRPAFMTSSSSSSSLLPPPPSSSPRPRTRPAFMQRHSAQSLSFGSRPLQLPSFLDRSTQSARNSGFLDSASDEPLDYDDMTKMEQGGSSGYGPNTYDLDMVAQRMQITAEIADILERQDFIIKLGKNLVRTGAPSHRIERAMAKTSKRLEIDGSYFVLPGMIMVSFGDVETHTSETNLIKCSKSLDISKLAMVNDIAHQVAKGKLGLAEASKQLDDIKASPPTWNIWMTLVGYTLSSAFISPLFFGGSWTDCWVSALFGLGVGMATFVSERLPMFGNVFEMAVTIVVSVIALSLNTKVCYTAVSLSAVVVALPGYALTSAVMELAAKNICSGTVHLVHAIMYVMFLAFGMGYGSSVWALAHPDRVMTMDACSDPVDPYWYFLMLPLACLGIGITFGTNLRQYPVFTLNAGVGFLVYYFMAKVVGANSIITPSVGAFALGITGNIYARLTNRLAFVPLIGGIIILVPGSLGVRGAVSLFEDGSDNANGMFAFQIIGIALSITLGLFLSNLCVYPTGRKRSVFLGF